MNMNDVATKPIGIFDSGIGGLTVAKEIADRLPCESILYVGDTRRCPYGPRDLAEVRVFVRQISTWLAVHDVKLIVIACNTATAAGLAMAQGLFDIPIIGVVEPGARAAIQATKRRRVGVIGTQATIGSGVYEAAIRHFRPGIEVFSVATPRLVDIAEDGLHLDIEGQVAQAFYDEAHRIVASYLEPLGQRDIDALVLGCTHFPLLVPFISEVMGPDVALISSAEKTAIDVAETLCRLDQRAPEDHAACYTFATTAENPAEFAQLGSRIFGREIGDPIGIGLEELTSLVAGQEE